MTTNCRHDTDSSRDEPSREPLCTDGVTTNCKNVNDIKKDADGSYQLRAGPRCKFTVGDQDAVTDEYVSYNKIYIDPPSKCIATTTIVTAVIGEKEKTVATILPSSRNSPIFLKDVGVIYNKNVKKYNFYCGTIKDQNYAGGVGNCKVPYTKFTSFDVSSKNIKKGGVINFNWNIEFPKPECKIVATSLKDKSLIFDTSSPSYLSKKASESGMNLTILQKLKSSVTGTLDIGVKENSEKVISTGSYNTITKSIRKNDTFYKLNESVRFTASCSDSVVGDSVIIKDVYTSESSQ